MAKILKRYFRDIKEEGKFSDVAVLIAGGIIFFSGLFVAVLDFFVIQGMSYHFDLVSLAGLVLLLVGSALRVQARRLLGEYFSPVVRILPEHRLIRHGVYKYIRHPGYLGELLLYFSVPLLFHSLYGFFVMVFLIPLILYRIRVEEKMLIEKFGDEYRDYMRKSKRFIPYVF